MLGTKKEGIDKLRSSLINNQLKTKYHENIRQQPDYRTITELTQLRLEPEKKVPIS